MLPCWPSETDGLEEKYGRKFSLGERLADRVSGAVGSWSFVLTQTAALMTWVVNANFLDNDPIRSPAHPLLFLGQCGSKTNAIGCGEQVSDKQNPS